MEKVTFWVLGDERLELGTHFCLLGGSGAIGGCRETQDMFRAYCWLCAQESSWPLIEIILRIKHWWATCIYGKSLNSCTISLVRRHIFWIIQFNVQTFHRFKFLCGPFNFKYLSSRYFSFEVHVANEVKQ